VKDAASQPDEGPLVDDLPFWACVLDVPEAELEFVVRMVGPDANAVGRYLCVLRQSGAGCH
jgi:hypothetical protein